MEQRPGCRRPQRGWDTEDAGIHEDSDDGFALRYYHADYPADGKTLYCQREREIAMLKSVGFSDRSIQFWQVVRMVSVTVCSMIAAIPLSLLSNQFVLKPIFAIMGAEVKIQVVPWQVYGVYPLILLLGIIAATVIASRSVKRINIQELNNLE